MKKMHHGTHNKQKKSPDVDNIDSEVSSADDLQDVQDVDPLSSSKEDSGYLPHHAAAPPNLTQKPSGAAEADEAYTLELANDDSMEDNPTSCEAYRTLLNPEKPSVRSFLPRFRGQLFRQFASPHSSSSLILSDTQSACSKRIRDFFLLILKPISLIIGLIDRYNEQTENPKALENRFKKFLLITAASLGPTFSTYSLPSLLVWTYCGTEINPASNSNCVYNEKTWLLLNFGVASAFFLMAFIAHWLRIKWDVSPVLSFETQQARELTLLSTIRQVIEKRLEEIQGKALSSEPNQQLPSIFRYIQREQGDLWNSLDQISTIIAKFNCKKINKPYSIRSKVHYSALIALIHKTIRFTAYFIVGASFYFLSQFCISRLSKGAEWRITYWSWLFSTTFGLFAACSVSDPLSNIETLAQANYLQTMRKKAFELNDLFRNALFPLAVLSLFYANIRPQIFDEDIPAQLEQVKICMKQAVIGSLHAQLPTLCSPTLVSRRVVLDLTERAIQNGQTTQTLLQTFQELFNLNPLAESPVTDPTLEFQSAVVILFRYMGLRAQELELNGFSDIFDAEQVMNDLSLPR